MSFTFKGVSIPYIQLLMRGDILIIAPLVDLMFGRRVRWWSWVALAMVALALFITLRARGGLDLPPLAIATVALYTAGYFFRLTIMTRVAKDGDPASLRRYFVEEKIFALPLSVACLAAFSATGLGSQADELSFGFIGVWSNPVLIWLCVIAFTLTIVSIFSIIILLDPRENAYCVPMERAASLVAGLGAAHPARLVLGPARAQRGRVDRGRDPDCRHRPAFARAAIATVAANNFVTAHETPFHAEDATQEGRAVHCKGENL